MNPNRHRFEFTPTSPCEIIVIIKNMKRKASERYDKIPTSLIIDGREELALPLSHLIHRCLAHSVFPTAKKCAKITSFYKSDDKAVMDNYHPISLLPVNQLFRKSLREFCIANSIHISKKQPSFGLPVGISMEIIY